MKALQKKYSVISLDRNSALTNTPMLERRNAERRKIKPVALAETIKQQIEHYFNQLNGHDAPNLHALVMAEIEKPILQATLKFVGYNQSKAAKVLGLSRSTLRKKLQQYQLL
jgi:Fis family transcriptional regulator, factor for inversion stimulation protein